MPSQLQTVTIQAAVLNITSSILAQLMTSYRKGSLAASASTVNPLSLQVTPIIQFLIFCLLSTPPNFLWQEYLEKKFPGYPAQQGKLKLKLDDEGKGVTVEKKLDVRNTATKFVLDQTLGAATNTALFLVVLEILRGGGLEKCIEVLREQFWPIMSAGYKLWPLVSLLNFTVIPVEKRIVVASVVGLGWGVYLALKATA